MSVLTKFIGLVFIIISFFTLNSCVSVQSLSGNFAPILPMQVKNDSFLSKHVRFGGTIISTLPLSNGTTCFVVLGLKLHNNGKPYDKKPQNFVGRFIACAKGYYDPEIYQKDMKITFVGTISALKKEKVGDFEYLYPVIDAKKLYLWPKEEKENNNYLPCFRSYSLLPCP